MSIDTIIACTTMFIVLGITIWANVYIKTPEDIKKVINATKFKLFNVLVFLCIAQAIFFLVLEFISNSPITRKTLFNIFVHSITIFVLVSGLFALSFINLFKDALKRLNNIQASKDFSKLLKELQDFNKSI